MRVHGSGFSIRDLGSRVEGGAEVCDGKASRVPDEVHRRGVAVLLLSDYGSTIFKRLWVHDFQGFMGHKPWSMVAG